MTVVRDAGFSWKQRGNVGSGPPIAPPPPPGTNKYQESNEICSLVLTYDDKQKIILIEFV